MAYVTVAVEIDHGNLKTSEPEKLPEKAKGLLTILPEDLSTGPQPATPLAALEAPQKHLNLTREQADEWMVAVRESRR
ncbi:MAG TPA: hypothetical protein VHH88_11495 [Verrucomicrobiae bacterium]|nr:hypothetical protein [Verrucomicrobiae bacterium]